MLHRFFRFVAPSTTIRSRSNRKCLASASTAVKFMLCFLWTNRDSSACETPVSLAMRYRLSPAVRIAARNRSEMLVRLLIVFTFYHLTLSNASTHSPHTYLDPCDLGCPRERTLIIFTGDDGTAGSAEKATVNGLSRTAS